MYSIEETAELLGIGRTLAYELIQEGRLPSVKLGTRRFVPRSDLEQFIEVLRREVA